MKDLVIKTANGVGIKCGKEIVANFYSKVVFKFLEKNKLDVSFINKMDENKFGFYVVDTTIKKDYKVISKEFEDLESAFYEAIKIANERGYE